MLAKRRVITYKALLGLDIGTKRIGVAVSHGGVRIAQPLTTIEVDGQELERIIELYNQEGAEVCVVGLPRNLEGQETAQSDYTRSIAQKIENEGIKIDWQDEGLTSVKARDILGGSKKPHQKTEIDALAASLILQDYLEEHYE
jgi:putative Holliday junction resolvase